MCDSSYVVETYNFHDFQNMILVLLSKSNLVVGESPSKYLNSFHCKICSFEGISPLAFSDHFEK